MSVAIKILRIIFVVVEMILLFILSLAFYFATPIETPKQLKIERSTIRKIITQLQQREGVKVGLLDLYGIHFLGQPQSGWIDLGADRMSRADFLYKLTTAKAALVPIKIIPGETTYIFLQDVSKSYNVPFEQLNKLYERLAPYPEGVFFADTYFVPRSMDAKTLIRYLVKKSLQRHERLAKKLFGNYNQKVWFTRTITIASIIQKEAANTKEMPLVASVIYNRLKRGMPLQMDGALNYGRYSHQKITARRIREDRSAFNTYLHKGLPPYPVCIVSLDAIKAAVAPAKSDYLYFVKGSDGNHIFSTTYAKHLRHIKDVKKRNRKRKSDKN